jgi:hypothetical protein
VEADRPCRNFMLSLAPCRAFVSRTSGDGIDGRDGRPRERVVAVEDVVRAVLLSNGDEGVWARCKFLRVAGGVSSGSESSTHEVGDRKPTDFSSLGPGVTMAVEAARVDIARLREREAVRVRMVEAAREEDEEEAEWGAGGGAGGRRAKPAGAFLTILPILSSVVLIRAWRSCRSLKPLFFVV